MLLALLFALIGPVMLFTKPTHKTGAPTFAIPSRSLVGNWRGSYLRLLCEGAMGDWSGVYLRDTLKTRPDFAVAALSSTRR